MKRIFAILLALVLATACFAVATSAESVTSMEEEYRNVLFSNGFRGFCVDYGLEEAYVGDQFTVMPTSSAKNNESGADVSAYLKAVFTEGFHNFFTKNDQGVYEITTEKWDIPQRACWHFSDGYENYWDEISPTVQAAKTAVENGLVIPDSGYTKMVDETTEITFNFALMETQKEGQQCFFAYSVSQRTIEQQPEDPELVDPPVEPDPEDPPVIPEDPEDPVVTPTDPEPIVPDEPVVTPTDTPNDSEPETPTDVPADDDDTNKNNGTADGPQTGDDDNGANPPKDPQENGNDPIINDCPDEGISQEKDPPKTGDASSLAIAMVAMTAACGALVLLKKRK